MSNILLLETATTVCSVGIAQKGEIIAVRESHQQKSHAALITLFIEEVMHEGGLKYHDLDAVAVSMGPGSYTGLRIGVSTAKGICYATNKPLIAIDTLQAMAWGMASAKPEKGILYCPMIDARRMEVYTAMFDASNNRLSETEAMIVDEHSFGQELNQSKILFFGDGAPKCRQALQSNPNAIFVDEFHPSTRYMAQLATTRFNEAKFENTAYFEPFYLKDFVAAAPKVKGLR